MPRLSSALSMYCNIKATCIWDVKSMGIVHIHLRKMPLKYWGMVPSQSGPLWLQSGGHHVSTKMVEIIFNLGTSTYLRNLQRNLTQNNTLILPPTSSSSSSSSSSSTPLPLGSRRHRHRGRAACFRFPAFTARRLHRPYLKLLIVVLMPPPRPCQPNHRPNSCPPSQRSSSSSSS
jgi:hypothetical protein